MKWFLNSPKSQNKPMRTKLDAYMKKHDAESKKQADSEEDDNDEITAAKIFEGNGAALLLIF
jgi:hypothetical protein